MTSASTVANKQHLNHDTIIAKAIIAGFNLDFIPAKMQKSGWSKKVSQIAVEEYKEFLLLCYLKPEGAMVPSKRVDAVWHEHILDTQAYVKDCDELFGHYMHHNPHFFGTPEFDVAAEETNKSYKKAFGRNLFSTGSGKNSSVCKARQLTAGIVSCMVLGIISLFGGETDEGDQPSVCSRLGGLMTISDKGEGQDPSVCSRLGGLMTISDNGEGADPSVCSRTNV